MCHRVILMLAGLSLLLAADLRAECPELIGHLPGPVRDVAVSGDHAYLIDSVGLTVADISIPVAPRLVGNVVLAGLPQGLAVSGRYTYVAYGGENAGGLQVIDVSDSSDPVAVGILGISGWVADVTVPNGHAYVANVSAGLRVIDVSMPSAPLEVGFIDTTARAWGVATSGRYAYVVGDLWVGTSSWGGLWIIDVSSPSAPVEVGFVQTPDRTTAVTVVGSYAYVTDIIGGLRVIDVSTPTAPAEVGFVDTSLGAEDIAVSGSYAYVAGSGLRVFDISMPSAPVEVGVLHTPGPSNGVAVSDLIAFVASGTGGLRAVDVSVPSAPVEVGFVGTPAPFDVAMARGTAYLAAGDGGLRVVDVSIPSAPAEVGFFDSSPWTFAKGVASSGSYAFVVLGGSSQASFWSELQVIDVTTPSAPAMVGTISWPVEIASDVAVSRGYAYVSSFQAGLHIIDVHTPAAPMEVGSLGASGEAYAVAVSGAYVYVADGTHGVRVINVSTPSTPVEVGVVGTPSTARHVTVSGDHAYVACGDDDGAVGGLLVIDVSVPSAPVSTGWISTPLTARGVAVSRDHAYVSYGLDSDSEGGLRVVDVSDPSRPVEVGHWTAPTSAWGVAASGGFVNLAVGAAGLYIFAGCGGGVAPDRRVSFIPAAAVAAGAQGAFFSTDVEINNTGTEEAQVSFQWLPRGEDNSEPVSSDPITLAAGQSLRYENVLTELFNLGPDSLGALKLVANTESIIGMSRTYNIPAGETAGTFGQGLPAIRTTDMIQGTEPQRIIFLSENGDSRANVGCVNGSGEPVTISIGVFDDEGTWLETKTMDLGPWSNNQINRIFEDYAPVNGSVDVWADSDEALYTCYGSMLDNLTSDPTTILPQVPSHAVSFIPAAALAAGLEGAFFQTDVDLNNAGSTDITYELWWLPRGADNSDPVSSDTFSLAPGANVRYANVLDEVFGLEPDQVGALAVWASGPELLAMSRTYNLPSAKVAGTFGQELPGIPADRMITRGERKRIIFMNENDEVRSNVGCQNGTGQTVRIYIELFDAQGELLEFKTMDLAPFSNNQITRVFRNHAPIEAGYVDIVSLTQAASVYCYGSVLDNLTSDPTTVLPQ